MELRSVQDTQPFYRNQPLCPSVTVFIDNDGSLNWRSKVSKEEVEEERRLQFDIKQTEITRRDLTENSTPPGPLG